VLTSFGVTPDQLSNVAYTVTEPPAPWLGMLLTFGPLVLFGGIMLYAWLEDVDGQYSLWKAVQETM